MNYSRLYLNIVIKEVDDALLYAAEQWSKKLGMETPKKKIGVSVPIVGNLN